MATRASEAPSPSFVAVNPAVAEAVNGGAACRSLYIGTSGNLTVLGADDTVDVQFVNVPVGVLPIAVTHVRLAGLTAGSIVALL